MGLLAAGGALAQTAAAPDAPKASELGQPLVLTDGEVKKINKDASKITIKHGEIKNLDMPPMTMVFVVRDSALLERFQVGDKVRFAAAYEGGQMVARELQPGR
ncbi:MAG: copper-binding protein [Rhodoferax sp.]